MSLFSFLLCVCLIAACLCIPSQFAVAQSSEATEDEDQATPWSAEASVLGFLSEVSERRRVTTMFPNRQSMRAGVQDSFVNTSRGNLTFLRRDLVRAGAMPIVIGHVYDSARADDGDFGPGWKLAVSEEVAVEAGQVAFTDASNTRHILKVVGTDLEPADPALTWVRGGRLADDYIEIRTDDLEHRFEKHGDAYRLAR